MIALTLELAVTIFGATIAMGAAMRRDPSFVLAEIRHNGHTASNHKEN